MIFDLAPVCRDDASRLAQLHRRCFAEGWDTRSMNDVMHIPGFFGWMAPRQGDPAPAGLMLACAPTDQAEILTICVDPDWRRLGLARQLMEAALAGAAAAGAAALLLEVATDNAAALALYERLGFAPIGRRRRYYKGGRDALVLRKELAG